MSALLFDLRAAARALRRAPGFFLVAAGTLGAAIAVNVAMISFLNAVFFRPLPYETASELRHVRIQAVGGGRFEPLTVDDLRAVMNPFGNAAAYIERSFVVADASASGVAANVVQGAEAGVGLLPLLGVRPQAGRLFDAADAVAGAAPVIVLGESLWRLRFGGATDVVGRTIRVDGTERTVIGVMPVRFAFPDFAEFWVPLTGGDLRTVAGEVQALVRLNGPAVDASAVRALESALARSGGEADVDLLAVEPSANELVIAVFAAIAFVLLIACGNVANLVLARGASRRNELALRSTLGASRPALLRYLLAEGVLIGSAATFAGALASLWLTDLIVSAIPGNGLPVWFDPSIDVRVLAFIVMIGVLATMVAAALPALTLLRGPLLIALAEAGVRATGAAAGARLRAALVAVQIALATTLATGAGLLVRASVNMYAVDPGFPADAVLSIETRRPPASGRSAFDRQAVARLSALPGVAAVALTSSVQSGGRIVAMARPDAPHVVMAEAVSPTYFETLGLSLLRGRGFRPDAAESDVAVISEFVARTLFDDLDAAIGSTFAFEAELGMRAFTVVGVAADRRQAVRGGAAVVPTASVYLPLDSGDTHALVVLIRAADGRPARFAAAAATALRELDPDIVTLAPITLGESLRMGPGDLRWFASIFSGFGALALLLAAVGIHGVVGYSVGRRTREIGVRMALGATRVDVVRHVFTGIAPAAGIGLASGMAGSIALGLLLRGLLFRVSPADPLTLAMVIALFGATVLLAAAVPARRAARIDPLAATRAD